MGLTLMWKVLSAEPWEKANVLIRSSLSRLCVDDSRRCLFEMARSSEVYSSNKNSELDVFIDEDVLEARHQSKTIVF